MKSRLLPAVVLMARVFLAAGNPVPIDQFSSTTAEPEGTNSSEISVAHAISGLSPKVLPPRELGRPGLALLFTSADGTSNAAMVDSYRGSIFFTEGAAVRTNAAEILATADKANIVVMALEGGPVYNSTNFGISWGVFTAPGVHDFPLTLGPDGSGYYAQATIREPAPGASNLYDASWFAAGNSREGARFFIGRDSSQSIAAVCVISSTDGATACWPAVLTNYIVQSGTAAGTHWTDLTNSVNTTNGENRQTLPASLPPETFFRLRHR